MYYNVNCNIFSEINCITPSGYTFFIVEVSNSLKVTKYKRDKLKYKIYIKTTALICGRLN